MFSKKIFAADSILLLLELIFIPILIGWGFYLVLIPLCVLIFITSYGLIKNAKFHPNN